MILRLLAREENEYSLFKKMRGGRERKAKKKTNK